MTARAEEQIEQFIEAVCTHIRCREVHSDVSDELRGHIDELVASYIAQGMTESEAVVGALRDMGSPTAIGRGLHRAHRPQIDWMMVALVAVCAAVGLLTTWSLSGSQNTPLEQGLFARKAIWTAVGFGAATAGALVDYRILRPFSKYLFCGTLLVMVATMLIGTPVMGRKTLIIGGFDVDVIGMSPFLLLMALPELMRAGRIALRLWAIPPRLLLAITLYGLPMWCFVKGAAMPSAIVYTAGFAGLLLASAESRRQRVRLAIAIPLFVAFSGLLWITSSPLQYRVQRLQAFLHPNRYAHSYSYEYIQGRQALRAAGPWGHGIHASLPMLPFPQSTMMFSYFTFTFGWIAALAVVAVMLGLLYRVAHIVRKTRDDYGAALVTVLGAAIGVQIGYSILMAFGALPLMGMSIPLLSSNGTMSIVQLFCFGVMLSVYRRGTMMGGPSRSQAAPAGHGSV